MDIDPIGVALMIVLVGGVLVLGIACVLSGRRHRSFSNFAAGVGLIVVAIGLAYGALNPSIGSSHNDNGYESAVGGGRLGVY